jgi:hypothetical protein
MTMSAAAWFVRGCEPHSWRGVITVPADHATTVSYPFVAENPQPPRPKVRQQIWLEKSPLVSVGTHLRQHSGRQRVKQ